MSGLEFCKYNIFVSKSDKSIEDGTSILCLIVSLILFILRSRNKHIHTRPHVCAWRRWLGRGSECLVWAHCIGCGRVSVAVCGWCGGCGCWYWRNVAPCGRMLPPPHTLALTPHPPSELRSPGTQQPPPLGTSHLQWSCK